MDNYGLVEDPIYLKREDIKSLTRLRTSGFNNGGKIYYYTSEILYKIFHDRCDFIEEEGRNVDFLLGKNIPHAITPKKKIFLNGDFMDIL